MVEETPIRTRLIEYVDCDNDDVLVAVSLVDILDDGLSMVYSFYDPDRAQQSVGTYMILDHVRIAQEMNLPYVYLGYWVPGSQKMQYKASFSPLEIFSGGEWGELSDPDTFRPDTHPLSSDPIAVQVANIQLPDQQGTGG
jgi:arginine-tRNA-protein transferase